MLLISRLLTSRQSLANSNLSRFERRSLSYKHDGLLPKRLINIHSTMFGKRSCERQKPGYSRFTRVETVQQDELCARPSRLAQGDITSRQ